MKIPLSLSALLLVSISSAGSINFDDSSVSIGSILSTQYSGLGVTFSPNALAGAGGPTGDWATNTDLTIVSSTGGDVGGLGTPSLVSGLLLRSFNGWLGEDGDASFAINFAGGITDISMDFAGISTPASSRIFAFDASNNLLASVAASGTGQRTLSLSGLATATKVVVTPGDFFDWVGIDNINFTPAAVPEPTTMAALGLGALAMLRRRKKA